MLSCLGQCFAQNRYRNTGDTLGQYGRTSSSEPQVSVPSKRQFVALCKRIGSDLTTDHKNYLRTALTNRLIRVESVDQLIQYAQSQNLGNGNTCSIFNAKLRDIVEVRKKNHDVAIVSTNVSAPSFEPKGQTQPEKSTCTQTQDQTTRPLHCHFELTNQDDLSGLPSPQQLADQNQKQQPMQSSPRQAELESQQAGFQHRQTVAPQRGILKTDASGSQKKTRRSAIRQPLPPSLTARAVNDLITLYAPDFFNQYHRDDHDHVVTVVLTVLAGDINFLVRILEDKAAIELLGMLYNSVTYMGLGAEEVHKFCYKCQKRPAAIKALANAYYDGYVCSEESLPSTKKQVFPEELADLIRGFDFNYQAVTFLLTQVAANTMPALIRCIQVNTNFICQNMSLDDADGVPWLCHFLLQLSPQEIEGFIQTKSAFAQCFRQWYCLAIATGFGHYPPRMRRQACSPGDVHPQPPERSQSFKLPTERSYRFRRASNNELQRSSLRSYVDPDQPMIKPPSSMFVSPPEPQNIHFQSCSLGHDSVYCDQSSSYLSLVGSRSSLQQYRDFQAEKTGSRRGNRSPVRSDSVRNSSSRPPARLQKNQVAFNQGTAV